MNKIVQRAVLVLSISVCWSTGKASAEDPGDRGPLDVTRMEYDLGTTAFQAPGFPGPIELTGSVHFPTDLSGGPFPFIVFLHGRHATCYMDSPPLVFLEWPCSPNHLPIPSYKGYDYVADILASHGFIVISISANGINAVDNSVTDAGMLARAQLIERHLQQWDEYNTTGGPPFGDTFVGKIDLHNIGLMGHSRGGGGVARYFNYNQDIGSPYVVHAVLPLAPVNFVRDNITGVPPMVLVTYCDGDVNDLQGVHYFDDARYSLPGDPASKHMVLVMGGNHNYFNTIWTTGEFTGGFDDWTMFTPFGTDDVFCGTGATTHRLSPAQQRGTAIAYFNAFYRTFLGGEDFKAFLTGDAAPPPSAMTNELFVSYHPPDNPNQRRDVNRLLDAANLTTNTLGGAASQTGFTPYDLCGGRAPQPQHCLPTATTTSQQPHTTPSAFAGGHRGLSQLRGGWSDSSASYENDLPDGSRDVSGYFALQFRASVNFTDSRNPADMPQDFSVTLTDGAGNTAATQASAWSGALFYPPGSPNITRVVPKVILNTIRIPLSAFAGVDLADIRSITFNFDQTAQGAVLVTDILFADVAGAN